MVVALEIIGETGLLSWGDRNFTDLTHMLGEKIFIVSTIMTPQDLKPYITHLPAFQVIVCNLCGTCVPPNDPLLHYKKNHTVKKEHPILMNVRHKVADYMATLDLCEPKKVTPPHVRIPELKVISEGYRCKYPGCDACGTSHGSMRTHYYAHQDNVPNDFINWEPTALQTFFDGQHRKYDNPYLY